MTIRVIGQAEIDAQEELITALHTNNLSIKVAKVKENTGADKKDTMLNVLIKYIPATVIIGYTFLDTIFRSLTPVPVLLWMGCFIILLLGAGILTYRITAGPEISIPAMLEGDPEIANILKNWQEVIRNQRIIQSIIAIIAFTGYVASIGGPFPSFLSIYLGFVWQAYYGSIALIMTLLIIAIIAARDLLAS